MRILVTMLMSFLVIFCANSSYSQYTEEEKNGLQYTFEEEKAAFDFYSAMFEKYSEKVFQNVMSAEKTHQEHVLNLMNELGIDPGSANLPAGEFSQKEVKALYDEMMTIGGYSFTDALRASARYEEKDIDDLRSYLSKAENEKIKTVYGCLDNASQNHLRSFVKKLKNEGINYKPVILSQEAYDQIISSTNQPGDCFQTK